MNTINQHKASSRHSGDIKHVIAMAGGERLKTSFINNMSHEMRHPLNDILGLSHDILKSEELSQKLRDDVNMMQTIIKSKELQEKNKDIRMHNEILKKKIETFKLKIEELKKEKEKLANFKIEVS